jgi:hypothetical protein
MKTRAVAIALTLAIAPACKKGRTQTPEDLRAAWMSALERDDPDAAWELLSPEARGQIGHDAFIERWKSQTEERERQLEAAKELSKDANVAVLEGRTTHEGGRELRWTQVGEHYYVRDGLPGMPTTMTAEGTIRAFVEALRNSEQRRLEALVQAELLEELAESWAARADAIEEALETPGALELSADYGRATLRYGKGGAITLERTEKGWRVLALR